MAISAMRNAWILVSLTILSACTSLQGGNAVKSGMQEEASIELPSMNPRRTDLELPELTRETSAGVPSPPPPAHPPSRTIRKRPQPDSSKTFAPSPILAADERTGDAREGSKALHLQADAGVARHVPADMHVGRSYDVDVWADYRMTEAQIKEALLADLKARNQALSPIHTGQVTVETGNEVTAKLILPSDGSFSTSDDLVQTQNVRPDATLSWRWSITPLKRGPHTIRIEVTGRVGDEEHGIHKTFADDVKVDVWPPANFDEFIAAATYEAQQIDKLFALFGTSIAAVAAYLWKKRQAA